MAALVRRSPPGDRRRKARSAPTSAIFDFPEALQERLGQSIARLDLEAGVTFMHEGEVTDFLAFVLRGRVGLQMRVPERGPITILTVEAGDIVGWSAVVEPFRATTSATTLEPTELAIIEADTLRGLLATDGDLAAVLLPRVLQTVVARLAATRVQLLDLFDGRDADPW